MEGTGTNISTFEIDEILESKLDETGFRLYKVLWKPTWIPEDCLQIYKEQLKEFWNKTESLQKKDCTCSKQPDNIGTEKSVANQTTEKDQVNMDLNEKSEIEETHSPQNIQGVQKEKTRNSDKIRCFKETNKQQSDEQVTEHNIDDILDIVNNIESDIYKDNSVEANLNDHCKLDSNTLITETIEGNSTEQNFEELETPSKDNTRNIQTIEGKLEKIIKAVKITTTKQKEGDKIDMINNKRKLNCNLENIVIKLKRSKTSENDDETESDIAPYSTDDEIDDGALSPVFLYPSEKFLNEKSSFLAELEKKDDMEYFNSIKGEPIQNKDSIHASTEENGQKQVTTESGHDLAKEHEDDKANEDGVENEKKGKHKKQLKEDEQLFRLLEDELKSEEDKIAETRCEKCNKKFYRRSQLIRHLSNHVKHQCVHCEAMFYCVKKFKKHMAIHETYPCDFCNEEFFDASSWYQHRAKHTMVECNACDMIFYNKTSLTKHKFEHLEYICPLCHVSLQNLNYWISHKNGHARDESFRNQRGSGASFLSPVMACRLCQMSFITQEVFLKHKCSAKFKKTHNKTSSNNVPPPTFRSKTTPRLPPTPPPRVSAQPIKQLIMKEHRPMIQEREFHLIPSRMYRNFISKKNISEMIGVDHTLACST